MKKHTCTESRCDQSTKTCVKCGETKPRTEYARRSAGRDGHRNDCKVCSRAYRRSWYEENKEDQQAKNKVWAAANVERARAQAKAYRQAHKAERREYFIAYRINNKEKYDAIQRASREANREKYLAYQRKYTADKWANDPAYRERHNAKSFRRKRLLASAHHEHYTRAAIFERDGWVCQLCFEPINTEFCWPNPAAPSIDHIVPLSRGGDDTPANVQAAHIGCNSRKGNRVRIET